MKMQPAYMKASIAAVVFVAVSLVTVRSALAQSSSVLLSNGLLWSAGGQSNKNYQVISSGTLRTAALVTHSLKSTSRLNPAKSVVMGVNDRGGGYINDVRLSGFGSLDGVNIAIPDFGKGWQGSIRDRLHGSRYNPTQGGYMDMYGAKVNVTAGQNISIGQFALALFGDPVYDFLKNEVHTANAQIIDPYTNDGGNSDADYKGNETSLDQEIRSEFDFSALIEDASSRFGIPSFSRTEYNIYARDPSAVYQFTDSRAVYSDGAQAGQKVFYPAMKFVDISPQISGNQTPEDFDLSNIVYTTMVLRLPSQHFKYLHYRSGGRSEVLDLSTLGTDFTFYCQNIVPNLNYTYTNGRRVTNPVSTTCNLDAPLMILSTSKDLNGGNAVGLFHPEQEDLNKVQAVVIDKSQNSVSKREDRRFASVFVSDSNGLSDSVPKKFYTLRKREFISGLLSPVSAGAKDFPNSMEGLTSKDYFLFGTPSEIYKSVDGYLASR